ncbi:unnamed protein product [Durusdinium trenchii]|uniref:Uncharacterized protein n=1 Tax=Durusdinium trenchii TaxID=1381693 RepID=A0ABP0HSU9_9DINO
MSPFCRRHVRWGFHIWDRPNLAPDAASPEVAGPELKMLTPPLLSQSFFQRLVDVKRQRMAVFFARKFDNNRTKELQDQIDALETSGRWAPVRSGLEEWVKALMLGFANESVANITNLEVWQHETGPVFFHVERFRGRLSLPCARRCRLTGHLVVEELAARSPMISQSEANGQSPLLVALRVGLGWDVETFSFGTMSVIPEHSGKDLELVMYWSHAAARRSEERPPQELEVRWLGPRHRPSITWRSSWSSQLVSWAPMPSEGRVEPGEWKVEVWLAGQLQGLRRFHVGAGPEAPWTQYFVAQPKRSAAARPHQVLPVLLAHLMPWPCSSVFAIARGSPKRHRGAPRWVKKVSRNG